MNPITFRITFLDGSTAQAEASAADYVAFETRFDKSVQAFATDPRLTYMLYITWHVLNRKGETSLEFEVWAESVQNLEVDDPKA
jgi:hypothetical protein